MKPSNRVGEGEKKQDSETEDKQSDGRNLVPCINNTLLSCFH